MYLASSSALQIDRLLRMLVPQFQHWLVPLGGQFKNPVFLFGKIGVFLLFDHNSALRDTDNVSLSVISLHTHRKCYCGGGGVRMDLDFKRQTSTYTKTLLAC